MLHPPPHFKQLQALAGSAPLVSGLGVGLAFNALGAAATLSLITALCAAAVAWVLAMICIWRSDFGTRHQFVATGAALVLFVWPWGMMLIPFVVPQPHANTACFISALSQLLMLLGATVWHGRSLPALSGQKVIQWPGTKIDVPRALIHASAAKTSSPWATPGAIGVLAVLMHQSLSTLLGGDALVLGAALLGWGLGAWLACGPLARACAQAWHLRQFEQRHGVRFRSGRGFYPR